MISDNEDFNQTTLELDATIETPETVKRVTREVGPYSIGLVLGLDDKFLGIESVGKTQSFLDYKQKRLFTKSHNVEKFFEDVPNKKNG